jgi:uncharacterized protein (TIGR00255 family)
MTGFGKAAGADERYSVEVEVRSLNNRYLKVRTHTPAVISSMDGRIENVIRSRFTRGAVDIWTKVSEVAATSAYRLDAELAAEYKRFAGEIAEKLGIEGELSMADYLVLPGVVSTGGSSDEVPEDLDKLTIRVVGEAIDAVEEMRGREGAHLAEDILKRAGIIGRIAGEISARAGQVVREYRDRLLSRVNELLTGSGVTITEENILREVSIFAERSDISEELARIESHLGQLSDTIAADAEMGRKLEFVAQELHREINTIGSKANDADISRLVVDAKGEIDKIREQTANLE